MLCAARRALVPALIAGWLLLPATAHAIVPQVHEHGEKKFFKEETVREANALIQKIAQRYKKDVVVETYDKIPDDIAKKFNYDVNRRDEFFDRWAKSMEV